MLQTPSRDNEALGVRQLPDARETADLGAEGGSPVLLDVLHYWHSKRRGRPMPARADIDPSEIVPLLPNIGIVEVRGDRLLCILLGTGINEAFGADHTGRHLDEILSGERLRFFDALYREAIDKRRPIYLENIYTVPDDVSVRVQRLILPLSADGSTVNKLLLAMDFGAWHRRGGLAPDNGPVTVTGNARYVDL